MAHLDDTAKQLVQTLKTAIAQAADDLETNHLKVKSATLEIDAEFDGAVGGGFSLLKVIELEASRKKATTQTLTITFAPPAPEKAAGLDAFEDDVKAAIVAISVATNEAAADAGLELSEADVSLQVGVTMDGSIKVFAKGEATDVNTQTLTLALEKA